MALEPGPIGAAESPVSLPSNTRRLTVEDCAGICDVNTCLAPIDCGIINNRSTDQTVVHRQPAVDGPEFTNMPSRSSPRRKSAGHGSRGTAARGESERLQKVLAAAGAGSRRHCEELITAGRVEVDREVITELGTCVDPARQEIRLDGTPLRKPRLVCYAVNKPAGVVCTNRDPSGRPRVIDLIPPTSERLFTVGRLDLHSEGLILVTNDGDMANRLTHPRYGVPKTYRVLVTGRPGPDVLAKLRRGVRLAEAVARVDQIRVKSHHKDSTILEMVLREGRNREIRRVLAKVGHKVLRLVRIAVGPVTLGNLPAGEYRRISQRELQALRRAAHVAEDAGDSVSRRRSRK